MIPYAAFMITLRYPDDSEYRANTAALMADGFTFRLPRGNRFDQPECVDCSFLCLKEKHYKTVRITDFLYSEIKHTEFYTEYSIRSHQKMFLNALHDSIKSYTEYIRLRGQDEYTMMDELAGFSFDDEKFPAGRMAWKRSRNLAVGDYPEPLLPTEIAVWLDCPELWDAFLARDKDSFIQDYWEENGLERHPIHAYPVTHVYIGNAYCPLLMPDGRKLTELLERAFFAGLTPVAVFSAMPSHLEQRNEDLLLALGRWCFEQNKTLELVLNDFGMPLQIRALAAEKRMFAKAFRLTAGPLLTKRKKDFRIPYLMNHEKAAQEFGKTAVDADFYRDYLRVILGFESVSYETCGYGISVSGQEDVLHLPLYQMNTAGYCTMYALCRTGDRGCQGPVYRCPGYCGQYTVMYPDSLPVIGLWNTVFGCDTTVLNDVCALNDLIRRGIHRLVIRL